MVTLPNRLGKIAALTVVSCLISPAISVAQLPFTIKTGQHPRVLIDQNRVDTIQKASTASWPLNGTAFPQASGTLVFDIFPEVRTDTNQSILLPIFDSWDSSRNHIYFRHYDSINPNNNLTYCGTDPVDTSILCIQMALQSAVPNTYIAAHNFTLTTNQWHTLRVSWNSNAHSALLQIGADTPITLSWRTDPDSGTPYEWQPAGQDFVFKGRDGLDNIRVYDGDDPVIAALLVDYPMNDAAGLVVSDVSGNDRHARLSPGATWDIRSEMNPDSVIRMDGNKGKLSVFAASLLTEAWSDYYLDASAVAQQINTSSLPLDIATAHPTAILNVSRKLGLGYLVTGEAQFLTAAFVYADKLIAVTPRDLGGDYTQAGRIEAMGILYDWFFTNMGSSEHSVGVTYREALVAAIKETLPFLSNYICGSDNALSTIDWNCATSPSFPDAVGGHSHQNNTEIVAALLAIVEEAPELESLLDIEYHNFSELYNPARAWIGVNGGHHMGWAYGATYTFLDSIQMWEMATLDISMKEAWQGNIIDRYIYGTRGDTTFPASGDAFKIDSQSETITAFSLWGSQHFGNTHAQNYYNQHIMPAKNGSRFNELLFWQPALPETSIETLDFSRWFRNSGQILMRDTWDYPNATLLEFKSSSFRSVNHHHLDQNAFTLYYRAPLLVDSGYYGRGGYGNEHWHNYFTRTIAHNTLTVFDPDEAFYRTPSKDPICCSNDGGQEFMPNGNPQLPDIQPGGTNHLDGITAYQYTPAFTYTRGNASKAYSDTKLDQNNGFIREIVFLRDPSYWQHPVTVIFDKVTTVDGKENLTKRFLLHTVNEPEPLGGTPISDGQYLMTGNTITVRNGAGMMFAQTLLPDNPILTKVGGAALTDNRFLVPDRDATDYSQVKNFAPDPDPGDTDEDMGDWRVEISASVPAQREYFLNVLSVADTSPSIPPPAAQNLSNNSIAVALLDQTQVVAFSKIDTPATSINWDMPVNNASDYIVTGLVPNMMYDARLIATGVIDLPYRVVIEQSGTGTFNSSSEGVLTIKAVIGVDTNNEEVNDSVDTDDYKNGLPSK